MQADRKSAVPKQARSALAAHSRDGLGHLLALLLAALVSAEPLLRQLQGTLEGGGGADLDKLDHASLVRGITDHLPNDLLDQNIALAVPALHVGRPLRHFAPRHDETLVQAGGEAGGLWLRCLPHVGGLQESAALNAGAKLEPLE